MSYPTRLLPKINYTYISLIDQKAVLFYNKKNNQNIINDFIKEILKRRNAYLKNGYAKVEFGFSREDQMKKFKWLLQESVITQNEYDKLVNELIKNSDENYQSTIGFKW